MLTPPQTTKKLAATKEQADQALNAAKPQRPATPLLLQKKTSICAPAGTGKTGRGYSSRGPRSNNQPAVPPPVTPYFLRQASLFTQPVTKQQPYFTTLLFTECCLDSKRDCRSKPAKPHRDCSALLLKKTPPGVLQTCIVQTIKRSLKASF